MVYIVEAIDVHGHSLGLYKIGFTATSPEGRLDTIQTGNPWPCRLIALFDCPTADDEKAIHHAYEAYRTREGSGEWFALQNYDLHHFNINKILGRDVKMRPVAELSGQAAEAVQDNLFKVYLQKFWHMDKTSSFGLAMGTGFQEIWRHYYAFCESYGNKQMRADLFFKQLASAGVGYKLDNNNNYVYNMRKK